MNDLRLGRSRSESRRTNRCGLRRRRYLTERNRTLPPPKVSASGVSASLVCASRCIGRLAFCLAWIGGAILPADETGVPAVEPESVSFFQDRVRPVLSEYCANCHEGDSEHGGQFVEANLVEDIQSGRSLWASVAAQLRNRTMPPADEDQPSESDRLEIADWIDRHLSETACSGGQYAGWVQTRRLNRHEYENSIRSITGLDLEVANAFPADSGGGEGFDNNGETLFLPPLLLERYLEAAQRVVDECIVVPPKVTNFGSEEMLPKVDSTDDGVRTIAAGETVSVLYAAPLDCRYGLTVKALPLAESGEISILLDEIEVAKLEFPAGASEVFLKRSAELRMARGLHSIQVKAPQHSDLRIGVLRIVQDSPRPKAMQVAAHERLLTTAVLTQAPSQSELPVSLLATAKETQDSNVQRTVVNERELARKVLHDFAYRAFRRPVTDSQLDTFLSLYDRSERRGDYFEERIKLMFKAVLVSPEFLFRIEAMPTEEQRGKLVPLDDFELATRLSYFLWSTCPDERLLALAESHELQREDVLGEQLDRMLDDSRGDEFFRTFVGQWLGTRDLGGSVAPTFNAIQDVYTPDIASDMRQEAVYLLQNIVRDDLSLLNLIDSDFQFMTGRLAKFYGLQFESGLRGNEFQKVRLSDIEGADTRGGVLGLGAVLAATSHVTEQQTSPVLRGGWILDTLLGTPVPPPPPDVPDLDIRKAKKKKMTLREVLETHRADSACSACHNLMDPLGFGLENFDFLGRWRDADDKNPVDAAGSLPSGEVFEGPKELKQILLKRKREFLRQLTRKVLGYAIGRSLRDEDQCTIETIVEALEENDYSGRELMRRVVLSPQFRYKQIDESQAE